MENRIEPSDGAEVPRKSRSLDLKSLYEHGVTKDVQNNKKLKRKASADDGDENREKKKKKSIKEVSLSSLKNSSSNSKKNVDRVFNGGLSSGLHDSKDLKLEANQKLNSGIGFKSISSLSLNDGVIQIPRRKRGFVGRKKGEGGQVSKRHDQSCGKLDLVDQVSKLSRDDSGSQVESVKVKIRKGFDDFKGNSNSESNSARNAEEEHGRVNHLVVSNGDSSFKKSRRKRSKTKNLAPDSNVAVKEAEPLADNSATMCNDPQEDDEENLEENAAMMLSSRFDPNCTGFSSNNKTSAFATVDGLSFLLTSDHDFVSGRSKSPSGSESLSIDAAGRVLRPRKQHKEKGHPRKRRHFYEVFFRDLDADWVLNRRIKVFWPLDQSWYYGLVNDYDSERKLHHVKYDDRDEEWIDLQNERFKLLLFPSEVPGKAERRKSRVRGKSSDQRKSSSKPRKEKEKGDFSTQDDSCIGSNYMDSEPIISWLARSSRRVKSPFHALKKQKTSDSSMKSVLPPFSNNAVNSHRCFESSSLRRDKRKISRNSKLTGRFANDAMKEDSTSESISCPEGSKMPIVYFRRRFRKTGLDLSHGCEENYVCRSALDPVSSAAAVDDTRDVEKWDVLLGSLDPGGLLWCVDDAGLLKLTLPGLESGKFKFDIDFPVLSGLYDSFRVENLGLSRAAMLLRYGAVMIRWPQVLLEMLFVDNVVGLRFFLFEGCLNQALAYVFLVVTTFHQPNERVKFVDTPLPVTSIKFKLTCFQHHRKHLEFAFYNFSAIENSKWMYMDWKLGRHCLVTKQLPLGECTYDNIQMLQNRKIHSPPRSVCRQRSFIKGTRKTCRQGFNFMGVSSESAFMDISRPPYSDEMYKKLPPLALSFTAAPTCFLCLHLKMLMDSLAHISFQKHDSVEHPENSGSMTQVDNCNMEEQSNRGLENSLEENMKSLLGEVASDGPFSSAIPELSNGLSVHCDRDQIKPSQPYHNGDANVARTSADSAVRKKIRTEATIQLQAWHGHHSESDQCALSSRTFVDGDKSESGSQTFVNGLSVEIPPFNQSEKSVDGELHGARQATDLSWNTNGGIFSSSNPTAPRSMGHRNKHSSSFGHPSNGWSDGKADLVYNGFGNGPKKPRTQVSYLLPFGGFECSPKQKSIHKGLPTKRIRKASEKRSSDVSRGPERNLELLSCDVNILITSADRGWRECGAQVVLELSDHNEWKLAVKRSGVIRYSYKAHQFLQPGSTNRFTHAMMWKGGKDWALEFLDRSQWALFKEMHEECYNRNIRAASMKNIPIPGVRLIEEGDDNGMEIPFIRSSAKYFKQVETDIEMALNPSRILYDMDSDDEQWIRNAGSSSELDSVIFEEMFEKTMDMFENAAYAHQRDRLTIEEIEELMVGVGPMDVIKMIYDHWREKRQKNGMPLLRHLQAPMWERYQQQVREWELAMTRINANLPNGCQEKAAPIEKPPMFAFCMKPRGLEVPNKGSKQRSHRKISFLGQNNNAFGDQDGFHAYGRRLNGFSFWDEKFVYPGYNYDSLEESPLPQTSSPRMFSPRDVGSMPTSNYGLDRSHSYNFQRSKSKKYGSIVSPNDPQMAFYGHRMAGSGSRNGLHRWNVGSSEWPSQQHFQPEASQRHLIEQFDGYDLDEFRARDASSAAQRALNIAKLKRERAQRLVRRADFAIHKAVAALMTAEAIQDCPEGNSDGSDD